MKLSRRKVANGAAELGRKVATAPAWIALAVSLLSFYYTSRTFGLTHRPYVGIVEHSFQFLGEPPSAMLWRFVLKNTGQRPTWVTVEENRTIVTFADGRSATLPLLGAPGGGIYLMPGQTADLGGQFSDAGGTVRTAEVLDGRTRLEVSIQLTYGARAAFWWTRYNYWSWHQFRTQPLPARFIMLSGGGT